jgi:hypothetical protein
MADMIPTTPTPAALARYERALADLALAGRLQRDLSEAADLSSRKVDLTSLGGMLAAYGTKEC